MPNAMVKKEKGNLFMAVSDTLLLRRAASGDQASFERLFYRHYDRVYGLLFRLLGNRDEAEDMTQEVFIKLYQRKFGPDQEHNVGAWLYRVAMNTGYNALRSRQRRWQRNTHLVPDATDAEPEPAAELAQRQTQARVRATLARLSQRDSQLLLLREMGFSYAELAEISGVAPGSVGTLLRRAAEAFRHAYRQTGETFASEEELDDE